MLESYIILKHFIEHAVSYYNVLHHGTIYFDHPNKNKLFIQM